MPSAVSQVPLEVWLVVQLATPGVLLVVSWALLVTSSTTLPARSETLSKELQMLLGASSVVQRALLEMLLTLLQVPLEGS